MRPVIDAVRGIPAVLLIVPTLLVTLGLSSCSHREQEAVRPAVTAVQVELASISWLPGETLHATFDARDLTVCGDHLVASGHPGVMTVPASGDGETILVETPGEARHAACWGDGLLVADGYAGLAVVAGDSVRSELDLGGEVTWVAVNGSRAVVTLEEGTLVVLELGADGYAAESVVEVVGTVSLPGYLRHVAFADDERVWVVGYSHGVALVDLSDPARPTLRESWRGLRKPAVSASDQGRLVVSDTSRQIALLEVGVDGMIAPRAVLDTEVFMRVLALRGTEVAMSDGQGFTTRVDAAEPLDDGRATEIARYEQSVNALGGDSRQWYAITSDAGWAVLGAGGEVQVFRRDSPHWPTRQVQSDERFLSLSGRGCDGIEIDRSQGPPVLGEGFQIVGAECRCALFDRGWWVGGATGVYRPDGERIQPTRVTDLRVLGGGGGFALAIEEQKGVVLVETLDQAVARRRCGGRILGSSFADGAEGQLVAVDHYFAHMTLLSEDDPEFCQGVPMQGPAADVWETDRLLFVAEKLYGVEVFERERLHHGAVSYLALPEEDVTAVATAGDRLFLGLGPRGLAVHELEGASVGPRIGVWETPGTVSDLAVVGDHLVVADRTSSRVVDLDVIR